MAVVDVATAAACAVILLVLIDAVGVCLGQYLACHAGLGCIEVGVWLEGAGLLLHLAAGLLLSVSSVSTTSTAASARVVLSASLVLLLLELHRLLELHLLLELH